jgi:hypothetical protein
MGTARNGRWALAFPPSCLSCSRCSRVNAELGACDVFASRLQCSMGGTACTWELRTILLAASLLLDVAGWCVLDVLFSGSFDLISGACLDAWVTTCLLASNVNVRMCVLMMLMKRERPRS